MKHNLHHESKSSEIEFINNTFILKKGEFHFRQLIESLNLNQK